MGTLGFVCPTTGREVDTGIEVDSLSFTSLHSEQLGCPECLETHQLSLIKACSRPARAARVSSPLFSRASGKQTSASASTQSKVPTSALPAS
jgi:hypothetical protein